MAMYCPLAWRTFVYQRVKIFYTIFWYFQLGLQYMISTHLPMHHNISNSPFIIQSGHPRLQQVWRPTAQWSQCGRDVSFPYAGHSTTPNCASCQWVRALWKSLHSLKMCIQGKLGFVHMFWQEHKISTQVMLRLFLVSS